MFPLRSWGSEAYEGVHAAPGPRPRIIRLTGVISANVRCSKDAAVKGMAR
jgi:hypothetical protein